MKCSLWMYCRGCSRYPRCTGSLTAATPRQTKKSVILCLTCTPAAIYTHQYNFSASHSYLFLIHFFFSDRLLEVRCLWFSSLWCANSPTVCINMKNRIEKREREDVRAGYFGFELSPCRVIICCLTICSSVRTSGF